MLAPEIVLSIYDEQSADPAIFGMADARTAIQTYQRLETLDCVAAYLREEGWTNLEDSCLPRMMELQRPSVLGGR